METTYVMDTIKAGGHEITLAALNKAELEKAVRNFNCMLNEEGLIHVDEQDIITLFHQKGTVYTGCISASAGESLEETAMFLFSELQKTVSHVATNVLIMVTGNVTLMDVSETGSIIQEKLGENANIALSFYDNAKEDCEAELMIALV